jgi:hypothetical protein
MSNRCHNHLVANWHLSCFCHSYIVTKTLSSCHKNPGSLNAWRYYLIWAHDPCK